MIEQSTKFLTEEEEENEEEGNEKNWKVACATILLMWKDKGYKALFVLEIGLSKMVVCFEAMQ